MAAGEQNGTTLGIICGGGTLPFAVADAAQRSGRRTVLLALRQSADAVRVAGYAHHWIRPGQFGRCARLLHAEGCRDIVLIGSLVRPTLAQLWPDLGALRNLPRLIRSFRGGDAHLLAGVARAFEDRGFRLLGAQEIAPEILMPAGPLGRCRPGDRDRSDIGRALQLLDAIGPFDIGQAVVVSNNRVLAVEAAEGTDQMLATLAAYRRAGRIRWPASTGVLVKAPKPGQDRRVDLPSIGPATVDGAQAAGLAGIAAVAGGTIMAEPGRIVEIADRAGLFVFGIQSGETTP